MKITDEQRQDYRNEFVDVESENINGLGGIEEMELSLATLFCEEFGIEQTDEITNRLVALWRSAYKAGHDCGVQCAFSNIAESARRKIMELISAADEPATKH